MKRAGQHQVVVRAQLRQRRLEVPLVDQAAGFVDDEERVDGPVAAGSGRRERGKEGFGSYIFRREGGAVGLA
jgi:hypothetical protein